VRFESSGKIRLKGDQYVPIIYIYIHMILCILYVRVYIYIYVSILCMLYIYIDIQKTRTTVISPDSKHRRVCVHIYISY